MRYTPTKVFILHSEVLAGMLSDFNALYDDIMNQQHKQPGGHGTWLGAISGGQADFYAWAT